MSSRSRWCARIIFLSFVGLMATLSVVSVRAQDAYAHNLPKRIVADYGYWSKYQTPRLQPHRRFLTTADPHQPRRSGVRCRRQACRCPAGFLEPELNNRAHAAGVKVLLLLGGDFPGLEASGNVQTLVDNIAAFESNTTTTASTSTGNIRRPRRDRSLSGETDGAVAQVEPDYVLSIDAAPWGGYGYDLKDLQPSSDYFNIMMYDCAGPWTAYGQLNSPSSGTSTIPRPRNASPAEASRLRPTSF